MKAGGPQLARVRRWQLPGKSTLNIQAKVTSGQSVDSSELGLVGTSANQKRGRGTNWGELPGKRRK